MIYDDGNASELGLEMIVSAIGEGLMDWRWIFLQSEWRCSATRSHSAAQYTPTQPDEEFAKLEEA